MRLTERSVYVYFNLHKKLWSVKSRKTGRVMFHCRAAFLKDVKFKVSQAGRKRVLKEKRKNVHAGVAGQLLGTWAAQPALCEDVHEVVTYNPYKYKTFVCASNLQPVGSAAWCSMDVDDDSKVRAWYVE